jgi:hypothetical protein
MWYLAIGVVVFLAYVSGSGGNSTPAPSPPAAFPNPSTAVQQSRTASDRQVSEEWVSPSGQIWTGVRLYYGPSKTYVGEVLGGNDRLVTATGEVIRGLKLRMASGSVEWKDRRAVISGPWYMRRNDPAVARKVWEVFDH